MIVQTLKLPAPDSGFNLLHAIALGYQMMGRKSAIILPTQQEAEFYGKALSNRNITLLWASQLKETIEEVRKQLSDLDCVLVHDIKNNRTENGELWDLLIHAFHAETTLTTLIGSDTE
ncbi:hypothetical protein ATY36_13715 [Vibrio cidicii]|uniref:hypothetical protein n=1 Tax=Vibrio cidicii TaxID=1763883 RepID=UPI00078016F6|nr:hypothetical protein [Vibrio cidicii]KYN82239.1 hypothetical protein ATY36_13715 [Vibrio cidicii]